MDRATANSWKIESEGPLVPVEYRDVFTEREFDQLGLGLVPQQMEDKWFVYVDGLSAHLHRSWTGRHVYRVDFIHESGGVAVGQAWVDTDAAQGELDAPLLRYLVRGLVLGQDVPFPVPSTVDAEEQPLYQHAYVGHQPGRSVDVPPDSRLARVRARLARLRRRGR